jgi:CRISPR-associated protein Csb2
VPTLQIRFPAGRYHATPWGHHVNEGLIEWPPSPWRLLRALIACGFASQRWTEIPPAARQLIEKLASTLPSFCLPETSVAHSRHFMPIGSLEKGREKTTLVFDTWANVGDGALTIHWDCELTNEETQQLRTLAESLGYLGRSESWVEAEMIEDGAASLDFNAFPHREGVHRGPQWEQISLMAAIPPGQYAVWRHEATEGTLKENKSPESARKPTAKQLEKLKTQAIAPYPSDLLSCLTRDTAWWKLHGWSQPPGSQRVLYWRRCDALQVGVPERVKHPDPKPVIAMLLAITTRSGRRSALPACTRTLPQAEMLHRQLVGRVGNGERVHCPELTGRDDQGQALRTNHQHAHILPVNLKGDGDGRIDHLIIYAKMGLREPAQEAIRTLHRTWMKGNPDPLQLAVAAYGEIDVLRMLSAPLDRQINRVLGPTQGARVWESATPFVPPRFIKRTGRNTLLGQINAELASRGLPAVETFEFLPDLTRKLRHHVRRRNHGGVPPLCDIGYGLRITLSEAIGGPLTLGYAAHFGLGMFHAVDD